MNPALDPPRIVVPDLGALKPQAAATEPEPPRMDVTVRWQHSSGGPDSTSLFADVTVGRDPSLAMLVLEPPGDGAGWYLIPPSAVKWLQVKPCPDD